VWQLQRKHGSAVKEYVLRDLCDEGWDSKIGEDAGTKCAFSNAFNAIVETNRTPKRVMEGTMVDPPE
jgi:hypothetical protein